LSTITKERAPEMSVRVLVDSRPQGSTGLLEVAGGCSCKACCTPDIECGAYAAGDDPFPFSPAACDELS
jgi:hypothetical protein